MGKAENAFSRAALGERILLDSEMAPLQCIFLLVIRIELILQKNDFLQLRHKLNVSYAQVDPDGGGGGSGDEARPQQCHKPTINHRGRFASYKNAFELIAAAIILASSNSTSK